MSELGVKSSAVLHVVCSVPGARCVACFSHVTEAYNNNNYLCCGWYASMVFDVLVLDSHAIVKAVTSECNTRQDKTRQDKTRQDQTRPAMVQYDTLYCINTMAFFVRQDMQGKTGKTRQATAT